MACFTAQYFQHYPLSLIFPPILFCQVFNLILCLLRKDYLKLDGMNESLILVVKQQSINESYTCVSLQVLVHTVSLFKTWLTDFYLYGVPNNITAGRKLMNF